MARWQRNAAVALGIASLLAGAFAVLVEGKDGAGVLALIAVGGILVFVGFAGALPTSIKLGDSEARWMVLRAQREVVEVREEKARVMTRAVLAREELALGREKRAREILSEIGNLSDVDATIARSREYPYQVAATLLSDAPGATIVDPDFRDIVSLPLDASGSTPRAEHVLVQGVYTLTLDGLSEMRYFARDDATVVGVLFIVADPLDRTLAAVLPRFGRELGKRVEAIVWDIDDPLIPNVEQFVASCRGEDGKPG